MTWISSQHMAGFEEWASQEDEADPALSSIALPQKVDNVTFVIVTDLSSFKGRDLRCYHHSTPD